MITFAVMWKAVVLQGEVSIIWGGLSNLQKPLVLHIISHKGVYTSNPQQWANHSLHKHCHKVSTTKISVAHV